VRFRDIRYQPRALSLIGRALRSGRAPHAYLFEGPEGVGKELAARALARRLLCEQAPPEQTDACDACRACRLMDSGTHPDFHLIHRGLHKRHPDRSVRTRKGLFLSIDVVRHFLIEPAGNAPALGRRRVFVVRDAERTNDAAQNALLKTLEEPPGSVCLILVTAAAERLLPTIRSRCQRVTFDLLPTPFVQERLEVAGVAQADAHLLARLAQGRLGTALRWNAIRLPQALRDVCSALARSSDDPLALAGGLVQIATELAERMPSDEEDEAMPINDDVPTESRRTGSSGAVTTERLRDALKLVLMLVAAVLRDALLRDAGLSTRTWIRTAAKGTRSPAPSPMALPPEEAIEAVFTCEQMLDRNVAPQLACERLAIALKKREDCGRATPKTPQPPAGSQC